MKVVEAGSQHHEWDFLKGLLFKGVATWLAVVLLAALRVATHYVLSTQRVNKLYKKLRHEIRAERREANSMRVASSKTASFGKTHSRFPGAQKSEIHRSSGRLHGRGSAQQRTFGQLGRSSTMAAFGAKATKTDDMRTFRGGHGFLHHQSHYLHKHRRHRSFWTRLVRKILYWSIEVATFLAVPSRDPDHWYTFQLEVTFCGLHGLLSLLVTGLYVYEGYQTYIPHICYVVHVCSGVFFAAYVAVSFYNAERPLEYALDAQTVLELFTLPSLFFARGDHWLNFNFLHAYLVLCKYQTIVEQDFMMPMRSLLMRVTTQMVLKYIAFIFIATCGIQLFELVGDPKTTDVEAYELTWSNALYFSVITLMTVGYGDFVAYTTPGRMWVVLNACIAAFLVARAIARIYDALAQKRRGAQTIFLFGDSDHVILCGSVQWNVLLYFVKEFYFNAANLRTKVLVLVPDAPWTDEEWQHEVAISEVFRKNVTFISGTVFDEKDMLRAAADRARAFFVVASLFSREDFKEDSNNMKRVLAIREYAPSCPIYSINVHWESSVQFRLAMTRDQEAELEYESMFDSTRLSFLGDFHAQRNSDLTKALRRSSTMCLREVELALMTENVFCNGLSTLMSNLVCFGDPKSHDSEKPWAHEYKPGAQCRMVTAHIPHDFNSRLVKSVAMVLYDFGVILIALYVDSEWKLAEATTQIQPNASGMFISSLSAEGLSKALHGAAKFISEGDVHMAQNESSNEISESGSDSSSNELFSSSDSSRGSALALSDDESLQAGSGFAGPSTLVPIKHSSSGARLNNRKSSDIATLAKTAVLNWETEAAAADREDARERPEDNPHVKFAAVAVTQFGNNSQKVKVKKPEKLDKIRVYSRREELTVRLKHHILICLNQESELEMLEHLLQKLWRLAERKKQQRVPIVVLHESYPPDVEMKLARHAKDLFLIKGNGQSIDSLKQAQLQSAMAVLVGGPGPSATEDKGGSDSMVMFTMMTLDYLLGEHTNTFVCGVMASEEAMKVLPSPSHPRRKMMWTAADKVSLAVPVVSSEPDGRNQLRSTSDLRRSVSIPTALVPRQNDDSALRPSITMPAIKYRQDDTIVVDAGTKERMQKVREVRAIIEDIKELEEGHYLDIGLEPYKKAHRGSSHGEGFEHQRYASGELLVPWIAYSAMIREYNEPGFTKVMSELIGGKPKASAWIRLVPVSSNYAGRNYRELVERLLELDVIPLGLYRSVDSQVRIHAGEVLTESDELQGASRMSDSDDGTFDDCWTEDASYWGEEDDDETSYL